MQNQLALEVNSNQMQRQSQNPVLNEYSPVIEQKRGPVIEQTQGPVIEQTKGPVIEQTQKPTIRTQGSENSQGPSKFIFYEH